MERKKVKSKQYNRGVKSTKPISTKKNKLKKNKKEKESSTRVQNKEENKTNIKSQ